MVRGPRQTVSLVGMPKKEEVVTVQFFSNGSLGEHPLHVCLTGVLEEVYTISQVGDPLKANCEVRTKQPNEWTFRSTVSVFSRKKEAEFTLLLCSLGTHGEEREIIGSRTRPTLHSNSAVACSGVAFPHACR